MTATAAADYIAMGWRVFILSPSKVPLANCARCRAEHITPAQKETCSCLTCHGFYSATADPERAAVMARRHPRGLLAVRTGAPSGIVVIDVDAPQGIATMRQLAQDGLLPRTVTQRSGGGGYHMLYRHPGPRIPTVPGGGGDHVDVKGDGGYFIAAPSIHPDTGQPYRWLSPFSDDPEPLPPAWVNRLTPPLAPQTPKRPFVALPACPDRYGAGALRNEIARIEEAPRGQRNATLNTSAWSLFRLAAAGLLEEDVVLSAVRAAAQRCGLMTEEPAKTERTIESARCAGLADPYCRRPA